MKAMYLAAASAAALFIAAPATAQSQPSGFSAAVTGGTLGIGPEVGFRASRNVGVRANATFFKIGRDADSDGVEYDGDLKLRSFGAMIDLYPTGGGFRVSGGARVGSNRVELEATPTEDVEIGETTYTPAQIGVLSGKVKPNSLAPTITVGWGGGLGRGFKLGVDAGVMFQGSPKVKDLSATGTLANDPAFRASLAREAAEIEDDVDNYKLYPVLQLSAGFAF